MKENSKVTDTNVGDIEENIEELKRLLYRDELTQYGKRKLINYYEQKEKDYKRVLKENEELKEDRKNNNEMIALARNEILNYMSGYEDGKKHKMTAMAQVIENQQYYIVRKQMEKYEEHIKRLQKENEELKNQEATQRKINELLVQRYSNSIPVQKVKDKIEEIKKEKNKFGNCLVEFYENELADRDIKILQELLEGRK